MSNRTGSSLKSLIDYLELLFSQLLRQDKSPLDKSALPEEERRQFDDFLEQMKDINRASSNTTKDHPNNGLDSHPVRTKPIAVGDDYFISSHTLSNSRLI